MMLWGSSYLRTRCCRCLLDHNRTQISKYSPLIRVGDPPRPHSAWSTAARYVGDLKRIVRSTDGNGLHKGSLNFAYYRNHYRHAYTMYSIMQFALPLHKFSRPLESSHIGPRLPKNELRENGSRNLANHFDFGKLAIQPKLKVSQPGDPSEIEADRIAEQVVHSTPSISSNLDSRVLKHRIQSKSCRSQGLQVDDHLHREIDRATRDSGAPLDLEARNFMESRFNFDFSAVKIHGDSRSREMVALVNARAFTYGQDIFLGPNESTHDDRLLAHELAHVVQQTRNTSDGMAGKLHRLGANPGCTAEQTRSIHQGIYDARGWLGKAISQLETSPVPEKVLRSLRRNFGPTYGVEANIPMIRDRLRAGRDEINNIPISCPAAGDATCATGACGYAFAGSHAGTVCNHTIAAGADSVYRAGCILHEGLHARFSRFTVDEYSGWHAHSGSTPTYPGAGVDPLLNADSYTTLTMDLS